MSCRQWTKYRLGELLSDKGYIRGPFGSALKRGEMSAEGIPVYEQQHAIYNSREFRFYVGEDRYDELKRFQVRTNDLIISCSGTIGKASIISEDDPKGIISQALLIIRPDTNKVIPEYLLYYFSTKEGFNNLISASHGSVQVNIAARNIVESIEMQLPDINTQRRIASILSAIDSKIDLNNKTNETMEAISRALLKKWFIDFYFPGSTGEMVESEVGMIPRGWRLGKIGNVCEVNNNVITKKDFFEWIDYIEISEVMKGNVGNVSRYEYGKEPSRARRKLQHGDTILSTVRPNRGAYFLSLYPEQTTIVSTGFAVFSPTTIPFSFLYLILTDPDKLEVYGHLADGAAYPAINPNLIMQMDLVIPSDDVLNRFHCIVEPLFEKFYSNNQQNRILMQIRDSLLPKLMNGEIEV